MKKQLALPKRPSLTEENRLIGEGYRFIAGIDEAGRGALAGPVTAAAVIMAHPVKTKWQKEVRDCKQLTPAQRERLYQAILKAAVTVGVGMAPPAIIDSRNIIRATRLAMEQAVNQLSTRPEALLIDHLILPSVSLPQKGITKGDQLCFSIACASIVAKVARDRFMTRLDRVYPGYRLAKHKGYSTREHLFYLRLRGPCPIHRRSFAPVREATGE